MAFLDEFQKLIVKKGNEVKISDKDKALILIAAELGGGEKKSNPNLQK